MDDDDDIIFRSQQLQSSKSRAQQSLADHLLASCHTNGDAHLWDLQSKMNRSYVPLKGTWFGYEAR